MTVTNKNFHKTIIDLEKLNRLNEEGCPACGNKFELGEPVVYACGTWNRGMKYIHENDAVFDYNTGFYVEKNCYEAGKR